MDEGLELNRIWDRLDYLEERIEAQAVEPAGGGQLASAAMLDIGDYKLSAQAADHEDASGAYWVECDNDTIGGPLSGATAYADDDAITLFTLLWTNFDDTSLPIYTSAGGASTRGVSAAADFAADKRLSLPDWRDRLLLFPGTDIAFGGHDGVAEGDRSPLSHVHAVTTGLTTDSQGAHGHAVTGDIPGDMANILDHGSQLTINNTGHRHTFAGGAMNDVAAGGTAESNTESSHEHYTQQMGHSQSNHSHGGSITSGAAASGGAHTHTATGDTDGDKTASGDAWPPYGAWARMFIRVT